MVFPHALNCAKRPTSLLETLGSNQIYIDDNTLSANMTRLCTKLEAIGFAGGIKTRRRMGYQLCG